MRKKYILNSTKSFRKRKTKSVVRFLNGVRSFFNYIRLNLISFWLCALSYIFIYAHEIDGNFELLFEYICRLETL